MRLDVVIPTYNRHDLIQRTLESLLLAEIPSGLEVGVTVVDNNSQDATPQVIEAWQPKFAGRLSYVCERQQGRSPAVNAGIRATQGDLVGIIDDDEEIDSRWYVSIYEAFRNSGVDYIGGPCAPRWGAEPPVWLPRDYRGVIGWVDGGDAVLEFNDDCPLMLMGGNAVLTRSILERVGLYSADLGRTDKGLLSCEDQDLYHRLRAAGARGFYLPQLIIYHYIPPERLTKRYYRQWCFWRGVSLGVLDKEYPTPVAYLAGVPRHLYGSAARGALRRLQGVLKRGSDPAQNFGGELAVWDLAGFIYGKHWHKTARAALDSADGRAAAGVYHSVGERSE